MILWTIVPNELIFNQESTMDNYKEIQYQGIKMQVEKFGEDQCRVVRIFSSNPEDYLRNDIQPGKVLTFSPAVNNLL